MIIAHKGSAHDFDWLLPLPQRAQLCEPWRRDGFYQDLSAEFSHTTTWWAARNRYADEDEPPADDAPPTDPRPIELPGCADAPAACHAQHEAPFSPETRLADGPLRCSTASTWRSRRAARRLWAARRRQVTCSGSCGR